MNPDCIICQAAEGLESGFSGPEHAVVATASTLLTVKTFGLDSILAGLCSGHRAMLDSSCDDHDTLV